MHWFGEPFDRRMMITATLILACLWLACLWRFGLDWILPAYLYFAALSSLLAVIDLASKRLPNPLTLSAYPITAALLAVAAMAEGARQPIVRAVVSGAVLLLVFLVLHLISPAGMGLGDVKLAGSMGMVLGWISPAAVLWGTAAGFVIAAAVSLALLAIGRATRKSDVPFGPSMLAGAWITIAATGLLAA
ncbi:MAG: prepilin peptidase [Actinobacteria bacterium]|uniref:Unannotated protein n=1 Tax=freshwater metagenome TaxID=449393 RepID=A0A6J7ET96_9ZZZZ|nr:prepilin peptidase [Actinomycetota bacterium]